MIILKGDYVRLADNPKFAGVIDRVHDDGTLESCMSDGWCHRLPPDKFVRLVEQRQ